jgi:hypothetical protein
MTKRPIASVFVLLLFAALACGCQSAGANSSQAVDPPPGVQTLIGQLAQVFTLTTSNPATYSTTSGALQAMPDTTLDFQVDSPGFLTVSFSARGSVQPSGSQIVPIVFIECHIDGQPCAPDTNTVEFLYPQFCCDTRSFQWVAPNVAAGSHEVQILWGMGNPTSAIVTNRTLIVQASTP